MVRGIVISVLGSALCVLLTGCGDECSSPADCTSDKGAPDEGKVWVCQDKKCVQQDEDEPDPDPDPDPDGGMTDGGPDTGTDGGPDTGTDGGPDAGPMTDVGKGGACTSSPQCLAGLRCEGTPGAQTCQALHVAMTAASTDGGTRAVAVRHDEPDAGPFDLSEATVHSRYPRWNAGGTAVAFVEGPEGTGEAQLVTRSLPLAAGQTTALTDGGTGGTEDFVHLEWAPANSLVWTRKNGTSTSGLSSIPAAGGAVASVTQNGGFPSWSGDGTSLAYNTTADGVLTVPAAGGAATPVPGGTSGEQPLYNPANNLLLYLKANGNDAAIGSLYELFTLPASGGTANLIAAKTTEAVGGGAIESFVTQHTWAPDGTWAAYVRAYFSNPSNPNTPSALCGTGSATLCQARDANVIFLRKINPQTGAGDGTELQLVSGAALPSFSPDGRFIAYVKGRRLYVQQINPATGAAVGNATPHAHGTDIQTGRGDDHRPRWQPR
jgi:hypothetical protein